jgi:polyisoprenoid-binding protein YceI
MAVPEGHYEFGPHNGRLLVHTRRQGVAGSLGHDLIIEAGRWAAEADVPAELASGRLSARVDLTSLTVVEGHGGALPLTSANREEIDKNARKTLEVARFAEAAFTSTTISQSTPEVAVVEGTLALHGRSAPQRLEVAQTAPNSFRCRATVVQSQFGIKPYSAFFGALKLRDEVEVEVEVSLEP